MYHYIWNRSNPPLVLTKSFANPSLDIIPTKRRTIPFFTHSELLWSQNRLSEIIFPILWSSFLHFIVICCFWNVIELLIRIRLFFLWNMINQLPKSSFVSFYDGCVRIYKSRKVCWNRMNLEIQKKKNLFVSTSTPTKGNPIHLSILIKWGSLGVIKTLQDTYGIY